MPGPGGGAPTILHLALAILLAPMLVATWLALTTAQLGALSPALAWSGAAAAFAVVIAVAWRGRRAFTLSGWDLAAVAVVALALLRVWPASTPWPAFLDASWYVNAGARIAAEGRLTFDTPAMPVDPQARRAVVATLAQHRAAGIDAMPADESRGMFDVAFAVDGVESGPITPYHPPFFSSFVALVARALGPWRGGMAVLPWAVAWLLAVAVLSRNAFGAPAGLLATALAALSPAFAYYGRAPYAEMCAGALAVAGLALLAGLPAGGADDDDDGQVGGHGDGVEGGQGGGRGGARVEAKLGGPRSDPDDRRRWAEAFLAGLLLGASVLAKAELLLLVPVIAGWWVVARRRTGGPWEGAALLLGLALPLAHFAVLATGVSRVYVMLNGGGVLALARNLTPWLVGAALVGALAVVAVAARRSLGRSVTALELRRFVAIGAVLALSAVSVLSLLTAEGQPPTMTAVLSWVVTPLALWTALVGLVFVLESGHRRAGPVVAVALVALPVVLVQPAITESLSSLYTARRLVPYGVPVVATLAAGAAAMPLARLRALWRRSPSAWSVHDGLAVAALAGAMLVAANLWIGARPLLGLGEFGGGVTAAHKLAEMGGERDVYLFGTVLDGSYAGRLAAALWNLEGRATAVIASPETDPAAVAEAVDEWRADGRRVLLVVDDLDRAPEIPGYEAGYVDETTVMPMVLEPEPGLPPRIKSPPLELHFVVLELVASAAGTPESR